MGEGYSAAARQTHYGRGQTDEQPRRATQVAATQVSGAGSEGAWRGRRWEKETARQPDERALEKGVDG
jgi:hypothetical protein